MTPLRRECHRPSAPRSLRSPTASVRRVRHAALVSCAAGHWFIAGNTTAEETQAGSTNGTTMAPLEGDPAQAASPLYPSPARRFEGGLRTSLGVPVGSLTDVRKLATVADWQMPVWADFGYRLTSQALAGAYGQVSLGGSGSDCSEDCNWDGLRLGGQLLWSLGAGGSSPGWIGLGAGYQWLAIRTVSILRAEGATDIVRRSERFRGPEVLLQGGYQFDVVESLSAGPYLSTSLGRFDWARCEPAAECMGGPEKSSYHGWLSLGIRGSYAP